METFTLPVRDGISHSDGKFSALRGADPFTMETFTVEPPILDGSVLPMDLLNFKSQNHLRMEIFMLTHTVLDSSKFIGPPVGREASCTYSVYKAAHRRVACCISLFVSRPIVSRRDLSEHRKILYFVPPKAKFCDVPRCLVQPYRPRQRMIASGFACKGLNQLAHSLNGNFVCWEIDTPKPRSTSWKYSFNLPNGMIVFDYAFYGKANLWLRFFRRNVSYELDTCRKDSPRLYGIVLRSVASRGGGPGSRWTYFQQSKRFWRSKPYDDSLTMESSGQTPHIYDWNHLRYRDQYGPPDDIYGNDDCDDFFHSRLDSTAPNWAESFGTVQSGYQNRRALRGTHRGWRSQESSVRRFRSWKFKQQASRRDYRLWKSTFKDSTLRTHGDQNPKPLTCPKPATQLRLQANIRSFSKGFNQLRCSDKHVSLPLPTGFSLCLATWNVEGLREVAKYDQILSLMSSKQVHLLAVQETKSDSVCTFAKSGWEILHSGSSAAKHHGVGFFVSPSLRPYVSNFLAHSPRICELTIHTNPHSITVFSIYAPSTVDDSVEDQTRKELFWSQLDLLIADHPNSSYVVILGDYNARLDSALDPDQDHVGPHVWGRRQSIPDPDRDNAIYLMDFLQSHLLILPQTFQSLEDNRKVSYKEMTSTTDYLDSFEVTDWTTLDYASVSHPILPDFQFSGSFFQQVVNTRHLPLIFKYQTSFAQVSKPSVEPKYDYSQTSDFYAAVEDSLLAAVGNSVCSESSTDRTLVAYTDGSCPNNRTVGPDNPAGWGFTAYITNDPIIRHTNPDATWCCSHGMVKTTPLDENVLSPIEGSNNTGEMKAVIELFDYILYYSDLPIGSEVIVFIDSSYVILSLHGDLLPSTHHQLVELAQQYFTALRTIYKVSLRKVPSHVGIPGNELADTLAKRGVSSYGTVGRFAPPRTKPLCPPTLGYNSHIWLSKSPQEQSDFICSLFLQHRPLIPTLPVSAKKPWISPHTLSLIAAFQDSTDLTVHELKTLRKRIKKSASKDKKQFISLHLQEDFHGSSVQQWRTARSIRKPFIPRSVNLFNIHGKLTSKHLRATTFAEYLSEKVWKAPDSQEEIPHHSPLAIDCTSPFTMAELNTVLRSLSSGRAPGPDTIPADLLKGSPYILKLFLLDHFNHCFSTSTVPDSWALSEVVMLVKKIQNDTRDLSNYRPISLTNSMYKVFASLLQKRLAYYFDDHIRSSQFGFRSKRSTCQPIHIMRRILEVYERQQQPLHLLFLDWSNAFDSVTFPAIESSLLHFGVPPAFVSSIMSLYQSPKFRVRDAGHTSSVFSQTRGLRQGCPLSPYLFNFVLSHMFQDVEDSYVAQYGLLSGVINTSSPLWDLEYADDTVLLSNSAEQITRLLHLLQREASVRGLLLNFDKCAHLRLNSLERVPFSPNLFSPCDCTSCLGVQNPTSFVPLSDEVKYLGVYLDALSNNNRNVSFRISQAVAASKLLRPLLGHNSLPPSWKLTVYRSVVQSILMYAMESCQLTPSQITRLNHVHYKSLRRIFRVKSSFYHRVIHPTSEDCSNQYLAGLSYNSMRVLTPSQIYSQNRLNLLGHLFRHPHTLEFQSTFMSSGQYRYTRGPNRVGRPRLHWIESTMAEASHRISHLASDPAPSHYDINHSFFQIPNITSVRLTHVSNSLVWMDNTSLTRRIRPRALNRREWANVVHKPPKRRLS